MKKDTEKWMQKSTQQKKIQQSDLEGTLGDITAKRTKKELS